MTTHTWSHPELGFLKKHIFGGPQDIGIQPRGRSVLLGRRAAAVDPVAIADDPNHPVPILGKMMGWPARDAGGFLHHGLLHARDDHDLFVIILLLVGTFGNYLIP
jgi:hypothetical protein